MSAGRSAAKQPRRPAPICQSNTPKRSHKITSNETYMPRGAPAAECLAPKCMATAHPQSGLQCRQRWLPASLTSGLPKAVNSCSAWDWRRCPKSFAANSNSLGASSRRHARSNTNRAYVPNQMRRTGLHANRLARTAHMCRRARSRLRSRACAERRWCWRPLRCGRLRPRRVILMDAMHKNKHPKE